MFATEHRDWERKRNEISFALRSSINATTGCMAALLTFGRELASQFDPQLKSTLYSPGQKPEAYAQSLVQKLHDAIEYANTKAEEAHKTRRKYYKKKRKYISFAVGDIVLRETHILSDVSKRVTSSLSHKDKGPYRVVKQMAENTFGIAEPVKLKAAVS
jgi:hypothetical protein